MGFSLLVELINLRANARRAVPAQLHAPIEAP
jgi:hypothetical protein